MITQIIWFLLLFSALYYYLYTFIYIKPLGAKKVKQFFFYSFKYSVNLEAILKENLDYSRPQRSLVYVLTKSASLPPPRGDSDWFQL